MNEKEFIKFRKKWDKRAVPHKNTQAGNQDAKKKMPILKVTAYSLLAILSLSAPVIIFPLLLALIIYDWLYLKYKENSSDFFFSNKVAHQMFRAGLTPQEMPSNNIFKPMCDTLKANGYNPEQATNLLVRCIKDNDADAIKELCDNAGEYGSMIRRK